MQICPFTRTRVLILSSLGAVLLFAGCGAMPAAPTSNGDNPKTPNASGIDQGTLSSTISNDQFGDFQLVARKSNTEGSGQWDFSVQAGRQASKDPLRFVWDFGGSDQPEGTEQSHVYSAPGTYAVRVYAYQSDGTLAFQLSLDVVISSLENTPPLASAGSDKNVGVNELVFLYAGGSTDAEGDALTFSWAQVSGTPVGLLNTDSETASFVTPITATDIDLSFRVNVSDGQTTSDATVVIHVIGSESTSDPNAPFADAGADQVVVSHGVAMLDGSGSSAAAGEVLHYKWQQVSGPSVGLFDSDQMQASFFALDIPENDTIRLVFELTVSAGGRSSSDQVQVTVNGSAVPDVGGTSQTLVSCTVDSDHDGVPDCRDQCPNAPDMDSDHDGAADCVDLCPDDPSKGGPGNCGCGIPETDTDHDGIPDCVDGCPSDPNKTDPGNCGCGVSENGCGSVAIAPSCKISTSSWSNFSFDNQTDAFTAEFEVTPSSSTLDGLVALSNGPGSSFSSYAALIRFNPTGSIDARNGDAYSAATQVLYNAGTKYQFRLVVNVRAHSYSAYVKRNGDTEKTIGENLAFRAEQNTVTSLGNWGIWTDIGGTLTTCAFTLTAASMTVSAGPDATITAGSSISLAGSASGGQPPYTYIWGPIANLSNPGILNPTATPKSTTTYTLTVRDSAGQTASDSMTINVQPAAPLAATAGADQTISAGSSAALSGAASGGVPPYTYAWTPATGLSNAMLANPTASPTATTTYTLTATDSTLSTAVDQVVITVTPVVTQLAANAGADVSISAGGSTTLRGSATGGTAPYTYRWFPSTNLNSAVIASPTASPTSTTSYTLTVFDSASHTATDDVIVTVTSAPLPLTANAGPDTSITAGGSTILLASAAGGVPPYTYRWSPSGGLSSTTITNPTASPSATSTYTLSVSDSLGGAAQDMVTITVNAAVPTLVANAGTDKTVTAGGSVALSGSASGGAPPYTYRWSPTTGLSSSTVANPTASPAATTSYTLTVTDSTSHLAIDQTTVTVTPTVNPLVANAGTDKSINAGASTTLSGSATGGTSPYTFSWSPSTGLSSATVSNPTCSPSVTTTYTLTVTDGASNTSVDQVVVAVSGGGSTGTLMTNLVASSGNVYVVDTLQAGKMIYSDRSYAFTLIPGRYLNQSYIRTANDDKTSTATNLLTFTLTSAATVYVGYESVSAPKPSWLNNWTVTGETLTTNITDSPLRTIVSKSFPAGSVTLGGANNGGGGNYSVVAIAGSAPPTYTITASAGSGGSISPSGGVAVTSGASQTFTITPSAGAQVSNVLVDGTSVGAVATYTFSNVTANHTITAGFTVPQTALAASAGPDLSIALGGSIALQGSASGGTPPYTYSWSPSTGLASILLSQPLATPILTTTYTLTVTDSASHTASDSMKVTVGAAPPPGSTFYVNNTASNASDSNPGTQSQPWKTLTKAGNTASAGQTVIVMAGVYPEGLRASKSGSAGSLITFKADPASACVFSSDYTVAPTCGVKIDSKGVDFLGHGYIHVEGFEIRSYSGINEEAGVYCQDRSQSSADGVEIVNNYVHNGGNGIVCRNAQTALISGNYISDIGAVSPGAGIGIRGDQPTSNVTISRNVILRVGCDGMDINGTNVVIDGNVLGDSYAGDCHQDAFEIGYPGVDGLTIKNNVVYDFTQLVYFPLNDEAGQFAKNVEICGNVMYTNKYFSVLGGEAPGIFFDAKRADNIVRNISIHSNTFGWLGYGAVWMNQGVGAVIDTVSIKNNIFYGASISIPSAVTNVTSDYNLFYQVTKPSIEGSHSLTSDPKFRNYVKGISFDFRLTTGSPAIDSGTTVTMPLDILGNARPFNGRFDMGAYEYMGN